ncbi:unnamed protein product [Musa acuminata subsp. malaccensis]|uniref:(wild Malaysian banana) hypothetical protein n=1 Tax=Musa acuminata subsp. malaccensis TaxID=214687 RepID=A0A804HMW2_MUSAM|nr:unnamed protein product [Musa acuminata subsp. malaccensis]
MIGSRVPLCTYNECRGCRFKCSAQQVPVDANDPINSPYHYSPYALTHVPSVHGFLSMLSVH